MVIHLFNLLVQKYEIMEKFEIIYNAKVIPITFNRKYIKFNKIESIEFYREKEHLVWMLSQYSICLSFF